jgi:acyl-CoA thioesterase FadM
MVKRAELTWHGAARLGDDLVLSVEVRRWGRTSFDVGFTGTVDDTPVFDAVITYVCVRTSGTGTVPVPDDFRAAVETAGDSDA